jgi:hypothetical protein
VKKKVGIEGKGRREGRREKGKIKEKKERGWRWGDK